jgi:cysteine synthase B
MDQYSNQANPHAHYETTAPEIWEQTAGCLSHFVGVLGTSGSFGGTARRLREYNPDIVCVSVQPDSAFHGLEGMKHMDSAMVPAIYDGSLADHDIRVSTEDAYRAVRRLVREEGLFVGVSSGAALAGCLEVARRHTSGRPAMIATLFADSAERYLSERFWDDPEYNAE